MGDALTQARRSGAHRGAFEDLSARRSVRKCLVAFWATSRNLVSSSCPEPLFSEQSLDRALGRTGECGAGERTSTFCAMRPNSSDLLAFPAHSAEGSGDAEDIASGNAHPDGAVSDGGESHGRHAATLRAVRPSPKLARQDPGGQVRGDGVSGLRKNALLR